MANARGKAADSNVVPLRIVSKFCIYCLDEFKKRSKILSRKGHHPLSKILDPPLDIILLFAG